MTEQEEKNLRDQVNRLERKVTQLQGAIHTILQHMKRETVKTDQNQSLHSIDDLLGNPDKSE